MDDLTKLSRRTRSPRLLRSRSGNITPPPPPSPSPFAKSPETPIIPRSKSIARAKSTITSSKRDANSSVKAAAQCRQPNIRAGKRPQPVQNSPSAWALSPGRSPSWPPSPPLAERPKAARGGGGRGGAGSGVLKYFTRQKKVSPAEELESRRFRVLQNGLLQWRFANARAEAAMTAVKKREERKLLNVSMKILRMRSSIMGKRIELQKIKQEIKLSRIISPEICLLKEWEKLENRNLEAVGNFGTTLSGMSNRLPLIHGAKVDLLSICEAMWMAIALMAEIKESLSKFLCQVEGIGHLLAEFLSIMDREKECLKQLEKLVTTIAISEMEEQSLRIHLTQANPGQRFALGQSVMGAHF